ncbi:MAG: hypothetical protein FWC36_06855 [Spirochaetes bacterium]|nr:hypothetical protein [Spirochaetota bacterium]
MASNSKHFGKKDENGYHMGTMKWALDFGLSKEDALVLARANVNVDKLPGRKSPCPKWIPFIGGRPELHFNTSNIKNSYGTEQDTRIKNAQHYLQEAIKIKDENKAKSLEYLGIATHCLQDIAFHTDDVVRKFLWYYHISRVDEACYRPLSCLALAEFYTKQVLEMWSQKKYISDSKIWNIRNLVCYIE